MTKFQQGKSGNPKGKPRGAKSRYTKYREALDRDMLKLLQKTKQAALAGDMTAMRLLLEPHLATSEEHRRAGHDCRDGGGDWYRRQG